MPSPRSIAAASNIAFLFLLGSTAAVLLPRAAAAAAQLHHPVARTDVTATLLPHIRIPSYHPIHTHSQRFRRKMHFYRESATN